MIQTLAKAVDAGYLTTFPSITSRQVRNYPPRFKATVKGHLKAIKKGLKYSQITYPSINNTIDTAAPTPTIIEKYDSDDYQTPVPNPSITTPATPSPTSSPTKFPTTTLNGNVLVDDISEQLIKSSKRTNYVYADCKYITGHIYTYQFVPVQPELQ